MCIRDSSDSVAELAIAHMFAVARFLGAPNYTMRIGERNKKKYEGIELSGQIQMCIRDREKPLFA